MEIMSSPTITFFEQNFDDLGVSSKQLNFIREYDQINNQSGMVLIVSPVAINIKETAYALINQYKRFKPVCKIITLEKQITHQLGTVQIEIKNDNPASYVGGLIRHNADIIYIEIPITELAFNEIAELANNALLIMTMRSSDISNALVELESRIDSSSFVGPITVIYQEIVRKACKYCEHISYKCLQINVLEPFVKNFNWDLEDFTYPTGLMENGNICPKCSGDGYVGNIPVFGIYSTVRTKNSESISSQVEKLQRDLRDERSLFDSVLTKALLKETTLSEAVRLFPHLLEQPN